jgi:plasmid maintenance system antidote protein VapI
MKTDDFVKIPPQHPGCILLEEYLRPLGITPHALAMVLTTVA